MGPRGIVWCGFNVFMILLFTEMCSGGNTTCFPHWFHCNNGRCQAPTYVCDGENDCGDWSDEKNCLSNIGERKVETCETEEFLCADKNLCVPQNWLCDGQEDCKDGSDEDQRRCVVVKTTVEPCDGFLCKNEDCLPFSWRCDGADDCVDGSDEKHCPPTQGNVADEFEDVSECSHPALWKCSSGLGCLHLDHVCDGTLHCHDGSDEGPMCGSPQCAPHTCRGNQTCHPTPGGFRCYCHEGYQQVGEKCTDIDECSNFEEPVCSQICANTPGSYNCSCKDGYELKSDTKSCHAPEPDAMLLLAAENQIRGIYLRSNHYFPVQKNLKNAVGIDYDGLQSRVYWTEIEESAEILSSNPEGDDLKVIISAGMSIPEDIAVDWLGRNLYVTDSGYRHIVVCKLNGKYCKIIVADHDDKPRALALYPVKGLMFWTSWGKKAAIESSGMDGSARKVLVNQKIVWPNGLALDTTTERLYWTDAKLKHVETSRLDGTDRRVVLSTIVQHPFSLAVFEDTLFWTDWHRMSLESCNKFTGKGHKQLVKESEVKPMGVHIFHPVLQPLGINPCWGNGCRHLCLLTPHLNKSCACAEGYNLKADGNGCERLLNVSRVLVSTFSGLYDVIPTSIGRGPTQLLEFMEGPMAALAYSSQRRLLYLGSLKDGEIDTISLDDVQPKHLIMSNSEVIESLAIDSSSGAIYWLDTNRRVLEVSNRNGRYTTEIHRWFAPDEPAAIAIDSVKRLLFVSVLGDHPGIFSMHPDGTELRLLVDSDLKSPLSLATDPENGHLYWADAETGKIERVQIDGKKKRVLHIDDGHPASISVDHTWVYWTDPHVGRLYWMDKTSSLEVHQVTLQQSKKKLSSDLRVVALTKPSITVESACLTRNGGCSHVCVSKPGGTVCVCPGEMSLDKDGKTCKVGRKCTNQQFSCKDTSCISKAWLCDGSNDCSDGEDERRCDYIRHEKRSCSEHKFGCDGDKCLPHSRICDGRSDCRDGTDEHDCSGSICGADPFHCDSGNKCVSRWWVCDHDEDCDDGSDETGCVDRMCRSGEFRCMSGQCVLQSLVCDGDYDCSDGSDENNCSKATEQCYSHEFRCGDGVCISTSMVCDGETDCSDGSDELNCKATTSHLDLRAGCPEGMFLCEGQSKCIPKKNVCDGKLDCQHGDDEKNCVVTCRPDQFHCGDKMCISETWVCDGENDCNDGSDENRCSIKATSAAPQAAKPTSHLSHAPQAAKPTRHPTDGYQNHVNNGPVEHGQAVEDCSDGFCMNGGSCVVDEEQVLCVCMTGFDGDRCDLKQSRCAMDQYQCNDGSCIQLSRVCDKVPHCPDHTDEAESCDLACRVSNGGCSDICVSTPYGSRCACRTGMKLLPNGAQCVYIDECSERSPCSHFCKNQKGFYVCSCDEGYQLRPDGHTCHASGPAPSIQLILSDSIQSLTMDGRHLQQLYTVQPGEAINAAVMDSFSQTIYLSFQGEGGLFMYSKSQNEVITIAESEEVIKESPGLVVLDWIAGNLYTWSAASPPRTGGVVHVCALHTSGCNQLMNTESSDVSSMVVDPRLGILVYSVWSHNVNVPHGKIMRTSLDGLYQRQLVDSKLVRPTALCMDFVHGQIYWADVHLRRIESALLDGSERREVIRENINYVTSMSIFEDILYWADTSAGILASCRLPACGNVTVHYKISSRLQAMTVDHVTRRPPGRDPCSTSKRRCSHICVPTSRGHTCLCPYGFTSTDNTNTSCLPSKIKPTDGYQNYVNSGPVEHGQAVGDCSDGFCMNGGSCITEEEQVLCVCTTGFDGDRCDLKQSGSGWVVAVILVLVFGLTVVSLGVYCYRTERIFNRIGKLDRPSPLKFSYPLMDLPLLNRLRFNPYRRADEEDDSNTGPRLRSYSNPLFGTEHNSDIECPFVGGKVEFHATGSEVSLDSALLSEQTTTSSSPTSSSSR